MRSDRRREQVEVRSEMESEEGKASRRLKGAVEMGASE